MHKNLSASNTVNKCTAKGKSIDRDSFIFVSVQCKQRLPRAGVCKWYKNMTVFQFIKILYLDKSEQTIYLLARNRTLYFFTQGLLLAILLYKYTHSIAPLVLHILANNFSPSLILSLSLFLSRSHLPLPHRDASIYLSLSLSLSYVSYILFYIPSYISLCEYITLILPKTFALLT